MKHLISQIFPDRLISLAAGKSPMKVGWQKFWQIDKGAFVGRFAEVFPFGGIMIGSGSHLCREDRKLRWPPYRLPQAQMMRNLR